MVVIDANQLLVSATYASVAGKPLSAALHPSGRYFVAGCTDFRVRVVSTADAAELETYQGHFGPVHCVRFYGRGEENFGSSSEDGTVRLWVQPQQ